MPCPARGAIVKDDIFCASILGVDEQNVERVLSVLDVLRIVTLPHEPCPISGVRANLGILRSHVRQPSGTAKDLESLRGPACEVFVRSIEKGHAIAAGPDYACMY